MRRTTRFLAILLSLAVLLAVGCNNSGTPSNGDNPGDPNTPVDGGTLNLSMFSAPKGVFNPILYEDQYDAYINNLVFSGLLMFNDKLDFICDLCESFQPSADNKTVSFTLKKGLKWHDGQPLTTKDVAFTFQSMLHPDYTGVRTGDIAALYGVQKMLDERDTLAQDVEAKKITEDEATKKRNDAWQAWLNGPGKTAINVKDDLNISFTTDDPYAPILSSLGYGIIPEHIYKTTSIAKMAENPAVQKPIGSGPFKFVDYKGDQYVELVRNETYHLGKPHIDKIIYKIVNQDVAIGQIKAGEIDYMVANADNIDMLQDDKNIKILETPNFGYQYMGFNFDKKPLDDKLVRQAIMYGMNRKAMVDKILKGHGTVMNSHMPPAIWAYDASQLNAYDYNPAKAKELLAQAGYTQKNSDGYLTKDGKVLAFTVKYPSGNKVREASAPLIQANLKDIGIKIDLQMMEFATLSTQVFDERSIDMWLMGWSLTTDPDPGPIFSQDNKWGRVTGWKNTHQQELVDKGVKVLKVAERKPIYVEWAKIVNDELPYAFLYSDNNIEAMRQDKVKGFTTDIRGLLANPHLWWIPKNMQGK